MTFGTFVMLSRVTAEFFWGEAAWGLTMGLRKLRRLRLAMILLGIFSISLVAWGVAEREIDSLRRGDDNYSYYEGKLLEERLAENRRRIDAHSEDLRRLLDLTNTSTLLVNRMQMQMEKQQEVIDSGVKILGAVVITPVLAILWGIFKTGLSRERPKISAILRRKSDDSRHSE